MNRKHSQKYSQARNLWRSALSEQKHQNLSVQGTDASQRRSRRGGSVRQNFDSKGEAMARGKRNEIGAKRFELRVGVFRKGRGVAERRVSGSCHLRFESDGIVDAVEFIAGMSGTHRLRLRHASARVRVNDEVQVLTADAEALEVALDRHAAGRIEIGDELLLFQYVEVQPRAAMALPEIFEAGFFRSLDWRFTAFVTASYVSMFALVVGLEAADYEVDALGIAPEIISRLVIEEIPPPPPPPIEMTSEPDEVQPEDVAPVEPTPAPVDPGPADPTNRQPSHRPSRNTNDGPVRLTADQIHDATHAMIGAIGESMVNGGIDSRPPEISAAELIDSVTGPVQHESRRNPLAGEEPSGPSTDEELGMFARRNERGPVRTRPIREQTPSVMVSVSMGVDIDGVGEFDARLVTRALRRRQRAIQRCYETALTREGGNLAGRVSVEFRVTEAGRVDRVRVSDNNTGSEQLASCVARTIGRVSFRNGPEGGHVSFRYPFVFAPQ